MKDADGKWAPAMEDTCNGNGCIAKLCHAMLDRADKPYLVTEGTHRTTKDDLSLLSAKTENLTSVVIPGVIPVMKWLIVEIVRKGEDRD